MCNLLREERRDQKEGSEREGRVQGEGSGGGGEGGGVPTLIMEVSLTSTFYILARRVTWLLMLWWISYYKATSILYDSSIILSTTYCIVDRQGVWRDTWLRSRRVSHIHCYPTWPRSHTYTSWIWVWSSLHRSLLRSAGHSTRSNLDVILFNTFSFVQSLVL